MTFVRPYNLAEFVTGCYPNLSQRYELDLNEIPNGLMLYHPALNEHGQDFMTYYGRA